MSDISTIKRFMTGMSNILSEDLEIFSEYLEEIPPEKFCQISKAVYLMAIQMKLEVPKRLEELKGLSQEIKEFWQDL